MLNSNISKLKNLFACSVEVELHYTFNLPLEYLI